MKDPSRRALIIAHEPDVTGCQLEVRLRQRGFEVDTHVLTTDYEQPNVAAPFPDWSPYDLIVPMGSLRSLTNKAEISSWIHEELDLIRATQAKGTPILGVCFGSHLLAEALGGSVETAPATEIGWYQLSAADEVENPIGPGPWMEWHHDRFTPPPGAEVLAVTDLAVQLFRIGRSIGTQFHPEVDVAHVQGWLDAVDYSYLSSMGVTRAEMLADARRHDQNNTRQCHALVDWFLDEVAFV